MAKTTTSSQHARRIPARPVSVHALTCLEEMAEALAQVAPAFAETFYGDRPRHIEREVLAFTAYDDRYTITTQEGADKHGSPWEGPTAHQTVQRAKLLEPLSAPAQRFHQAIVALPTLRTATCVNMVDPSVLGLSFHVGKDGQACFRFRLRREWHLLQRDCPTPQDVVECAAWRFHVLAHGTAWGPKAPMLLWSSEGYHHAVAAPDAIQARILYAACLPTFDMAMRTLFQSEKDPMQAQEFDGKTGRILRALFS